MTYDQANRLWEYNKETGMLSWKIHAPYHKAYPGKEAGCSYVAGRTSYLIIQRAGVFYKVHQIIWLLVTKEWPKDEIDHEDGNGLSNKWENLREVTRLKNMQNRRKNLNNKSGNVGVTRNKKAGKWKAQIYENGRYVYLGLYFSIEEAVKVRQAASERFGFHKLHGNEKH